MLIADAPSMRPVLELIARVGPSEANVLITGENGTGKGTAAQAIHSVSGRAGKGLVTVNAGGLSEGVFESELFGHVKGAFTDAKSDRVGRFELADGGTLFLDEIANVPLNLQPKLLRVLETGDFERVGSSRTRHVDVRIVSATNANLGEEVSGGRFRQDLLFRLNTIEITLPPLRDRREDIPYLVAAFVRDAASRLRKPLLGLTPAAERQLMARAWDGNIRELRNTIERACILAEGGWVTERELKQSGPRLPVPSVPISAPVAANGFSDGDDVKLSARERDHIRQVLERSGGNKMAAARALGLDRRTLYRRLDRYGLGSIARRGARRGSGA
jgi:DNA-binding NtrC family response regulator